MMLGRMWVRVCRTKTLDAWRGPGSLQGLLLKPCLQAAASTPLLAAVIMNRLLLLALRNIIPIAPVMVAYLKGPSSTSPSTSSEGLRA